MTSLDPNKNRSTLALEIGGQRIRLHAHNNEQHLVGLAQLINDRYAKLLASTRAATPATLLALVALELADELLEATRNTETVRNESAQTIARAEQQAREVEQQARLAVTEALREIERALKTDEQDEDQSDTG